MNEDDGIGRSVEWTPACFQSLEFFISSLVLTFILASKPNPTTPLGEHGSSLIRHWTSLDFDKVWNGMSPTRLGNKFGTLFSLDCRWSRCCGRVRR